MDFQELTSAIKFAFVDLIAELGYVNEWMPDTDDMFMQRVPELWLLDAEWLLSAHARFNHGLFALLAVLTTARALEFCKNLAAANKANAISVVSCFPEPLCKCTHLAIR